MADCGGKPQASYAVTAFFLGLVRHQERRTAPNPVATATNVTEKATERSITRPVEVELDLPESARVVAGEVKTEVGQLQGRAQKRSTTWWGNDESTKDLAKVEWVLEAPAGTEIGIEARHTRAGTVRRRVTL